MYAAIRSYTGAAPLMDEMVRESEDVQSVLSSAPGFRAYYAVRSGDRLTAIAICDDREGAEATTRLAAAWVKEHLPSVQIGAPNIVEGNVFMHFSS